MRLSEKFTPEAMLGAPRRSPAVPNQDGTLALYTLSTYNFDDTKERKELKTMELASGRSEVLSTNNDVFDALWVPGTDSEVAYLQKLNKGLTQLVVLDAKSPDDTRHTVAEFDAPVKGLKLKALNDGTIAVAVAGLVGPDGKLYNDVAQEKKSTARVFDTPRVWVWSTVTKEQKYSLWYSQMARHDGKWKMEAGLNNILQHTGLEISGVYDVADVRDHYDIGDHGILFNATSLSAETEFREWDTTCVYYAAVPSFASPATSYPLQFSIGDGPATGKFSNVRLSPDGALAAFAYASYDNDVDVRIFIGHVDALAAEDVFRSITQREPLLPPRSFEFAREGDALLLTVPAFGHVALQILALQPGALPETILGSGSVTAHYPLVQGNWDQLLVSSTNLIDSSLWQVIDTRVQGDSDPIIISSFTRHGSRFGLTRSMVTEIWYEGADSECVHAFIVRPSDFDQEKRYPWVLMPHGGPVSSWTDGWSTRWNMALWAQQGYVVVCPDIAGSIGYGLNFTKRIDGQWGGAPYEDLVNLVQHLEDLPYLDMTRGALAGASYGGYMLSWIFGTDLAKKFRCAIWHDGILNLNSLMLASDYHLGPSQFGAPPLPWGPVTAELIDQWNPARPDRLARWVDAPPTLFIHSQRDWRCPLADGLAAFRALKAHGVASRFLTFEDEGHWVLGHENSRVWHREVFAFLEKYIGKEPTPET